MARRYVEKCEDEESDDEEEDGRPSYYELALMLVKAHKIIFMETKKVEVVSK
jgi:hypothetical protein